MDPLSLFDADLAPLVGAESTPPAAPARGAPVPVAGHRPPAPAAPPAGPLLLAVDGNSLAHRAFHAYGAIGLGGGGEDRSALYGFLALLTALHDKTGPTGVVVGFDCREASDRKERYPAYKANRPAKDPALHALLDLVPALLADLGVAVVTEHGWEADDVVGSAAAAARVAGWRCVVATSDRDAFALVDDTTTVLRLRSGLDNAVVVDPARLRRDQGVEPGQYVELAALRGDTSDNLPGVDGIGPARAAALLQAFPTVAAAGADPIGCRSVIGRRPGQALLDDLADPPASVFHRNVALMTIRTDLPVMPEACRPRVLPQQIGERLDGWGLGRLAARAAVTLGARPAGPPPLTDADAPPA